MPVVLDSVVGATGEVAGDERPLVAVGAVGGEEPLLLLLRERPLVDPGVQLVEPPEPAALACAWILHPFMHTCINKSVAINC